MSLVSVVIPMYNRRALIDETLQSALAQQWPSVEVIVVDDGSTDGSADHVEQVFGDRVRLIRLGQNVGRSAARNAGVAAARGEYIAFLDSDDLWDPGKLARQMPAFAEPSVTLVHCRVRQIDGSGRVDASATTTITRAFEAAEARGYDYGGITATWCRMYTPAVVVRRTALERSGGFDPALSRFEDWDLFWRIARDGKVVTVPEVLVSVRAHEGNVEPRWAALAESFARVAEKHLAEIAALSRTPALRRAEHNLQMNRALAALWRGDRAAAREGLRRALRVEGAPTLRPWHPTWGALLLHAALPPRVADGLASLLGVDRYRDVGRR
jgi:glycosyltransferase involved in cell wall biosynthesis